MFSLHGETASRHLVFVVFHRIHDIVVEIGEALHEFRAEPVGETEHVVDDEHLPVAAVSASDSYRHGIDACRHFFRQPGRHALQNDRAATGLIQRFCVVYQFLRGGGRVTVLQKSKLIAVTVNPTSPSGYRLDSDTLCEKLTEVIKLPVYDLLKEQQCN